MKKKYKVVLKRAGYFFDYKEALKEVQMVCFTSSALAVENTKPR